LDLMTDSLGIVKELDPDDFPKATKRFLRMAKRSKRKPSLDELDELFSMLGLDMPAVRPKTGVDV
jgi:hypothetical protein